MFQLGRWFAGVMLGLVTMAEAVAVEQVQTPPRVSSETPSWSPDGARLVFSAGPSMQHQIYVVNVDGTGAARLSAGPEQNRWPSWSPDGRSIVFMSDRDGQAELYVMRPDGSSQRRLTNTPVHEFAPAWSPRGDQVAYLVEMPGEKQQLWVMNGDGSGARQIDGPHLYYGRLSWSHDGSRILVGANRDAGTVAADRWKLPARLYALSPGDGKVEPITENGTFANPWASPDGRQLVLDALSGQGWASSRGEADLWLLKLEAGAKPTRLTSAAVNDWGAAWSPDGRLIAFSSGLQRVYALTVMQPDGAGRRELTRTDRLPDGR